MLRAIEAVFRSKGCASAVSIRALSIRHLIVARRDFRLARAGWRPRQSSCEDWPISQKKLVGESKRGIYRWNYGARRCAAGTVCD